MAREGSILFRGLLLMYPKGFRREYGREMTLAYQDLRRDESAGRVWLRLARDTALAAPKLRMEESMKRSAIVISTVVLLGVAVGGIVTGSFFVGGLLLAGVAAIIVIPSALIARRNRASAEHDYTIKHWPWWSFGAVAVAAVYPVFGIGQMIDDPKIENAFALVVFTMFSAMITGGLVLRRKGRTGGDWLIAAAALPLFPAFWLIWPPIVAFTVMVGAMSEALSVRQPRPA